MKSTDRAARRRKAAWLCGGIFAAVLILLAFAFTLRACLDVPQNEAPAATSAEAEISFFRMTTAAPETDTLESAVPETEMSEDTPTALPFARRAAETPQAEEPESDTPESDTAQSEAVQSEAVQSEEAQSEAAQSEEPETTAESASPSDSESRRFILNTNTKKFHIPSCASVDTIKPENKIEYSGTRDELITQGYAPCKKCNP